MIHDLNPIHLAVVVGARPNFMKAAAVLRALEGYAHVRTTLVHTGQHYDPALSDVFFDDLGMKRPDVSLGVGSGKHAAQTARVMERMEALLEQGSPEGNRFDRVVVVGDVNSTMAAALAAVKLEIPVAHVEAGLRSFDRSMPEEINRIVTDTVADLLFVSEPAGVENLTREGHPSEQVHLTGNVMIDVLKRLLPKARARGTLADFGLEPDRYAVVTLHRPANVDDRPTLSRLLEVLLEVAGRIKVVFPIHPRTRNRLAEFGLAGRVEGCPGMILAPPLGYLDFLALTSRAKLIITDSGGLQEESTALGIPCLTMRPNTERPITVTEGTSTLVGSDTERLREALHVVLSGGYRQGRCPDLWDGRAAERIARILSGNGD